MSDRHLRRLAIALSVVGICLFAVGLAFGLMRGRNGEGLLHLVDDMHWFISFLLFIPFGALIALRHPRNPIGWLLLAIALGEIASKASYEYAARALVTEPGSLPAGDLAAWLSAWVWAPSLILFPLVLILFPTGRTMSPRWRLVAWPPVVWMAVFFAFAVALFPHRSADLLADTGSFNVPSLAAIEGIVMGWFPIVLLSLAAGLISVVVRFRRSSGVERQQLKWIALGATVAVGLTVVFDLILDPLGVHTDLGLLLRETVGGPAVFAVTAAIAMLRHRLFDIDVVINRTLVYAALTALLAGAYLGSVVLLQRILAPVTADSDIAVAGSTLAVAGLFRPLRARVQAFIDRRFYRRKYDAAETLGRFSNRLRHEVELQAVSGDLIAVVGETVQPTHVSLWLRTEATR